MRRTSALLLTLLGLTTQTVAFAADPASTNYQIQGASFVPFVADGASTNYSVSAVLDATVGLSQSTNWNVRHGEPTNEPAAVTPAATAPAATGGIPTSYPQVIVTVPVPTLTYNSPTFGSHQVVRGIYPTSTVGVWVNDSTAGVQLRAGNLWTRDLPLLLGLNQVKAQSIDINGTRSVPILGTIERLLIGDVNRDHRVNDLDLSLFTRAWKRYTPYADFNEDGKIDDIDLSLFASHWNLSY